jgi:hypothetical protein
MRASRTKTGQMRSTRTISWGPQGFASRACERVLYCPACTFHLDAPGRRCALPRKGASRLELRLVAAARCQWRANGASRVAQHAPGRPTRCGARHDAAAARRASALRSARPCPGTHACSARSDAPHSRSPICPGILRTAPSHRLSGRCRNQPPWRASLQLLATRHVQCCTFATRCSWLLCWRARCSALRRCWPRRRLCLPPSPRCSTPGPTCPARLSGSAGGTSTTCRASRAGWAPPAAAADVSRPQGRRAATAAPLSCRTTPPHSAWRTLRALAPPLPRCNIAASAGLAPSLTLPLSATIA